MTAPDRMSGNVWKVFVNTDIYMYIIEILEQYPHPILSGQSTGRGRYP